MTKLNQILAVEKDAKAQGTRALTVAYHAFQKGPQLSGISRTYTPKDEEGDQLPSESTVVQVRVDEMLHAVRNRLTRMFDIVSTKENGNMLANADVVIDGETLLSGVPIQMLLFLEKQLVDLHTFVSKIPVLDPSETWSYDDSHDAYATEPAQTVRTKKVPRNHTLAEATDKHPAQVERYFEDVIVGTWRTVKFSGALPAKRVTELVDRVEKLQVAVKQAREDANSLVVNDVPVGKVFFDYLFE